MPFRSWFLCHVVGCGMIRHVRLPLGVAALIIGFNAVPREGVKLQTATPFVHLVTKVSLLLTGNPGVVDIICDRGAVDPQYF